MLYRSSLYTDTPQTSYNISISVSVLLCIKHVIVTIGKLGTKIHLVSQHNAVPTLADQSSRGVYLTERQTAENQLKDLVWKVVYGVCPCLPILLLLFPLHHFPFHLTDETLCGEGNSMTSAKTQFTRNSPINSLSTSSSSPSPSSVSPSTSLMKLSVGWEGQ